MLDEAVEARIREMNDAIQLLREITSKSFSELEVFEKLSMRYLVIQLVEATASICIHMLSKLYGETAEGYPDCFTRLGRRGIISMELASRLASAARLRNLLVHRYWVILDEKVYESVKKGLSDFMEFIRAVREALGGVG